MEPTPGGLSPVADDASGAGSGASPLDAIRRRAVAVLVVAGSVFALYTGAIGPFTAPVQRGVFVLIILPLIFLLVPSTLFGRPARNGVLDLVLAAASVAVMVWLLIGYDRLFPELFIGVPDLVFGVAGLLLVLEAVRRTVGPGITLILLVFLEFALFGDRIPVEGLRHGGLSLGAVVSIVFYSTDGVFGTPIGVCATFIVLMIMLGTILTVTGGAELFMNIAKSIGGRFVGGPAKIAVVGSALMGMITGATVANVATTGPVTIPMMKRAGYSPRFAGAVEALASSGGQLMPPIMGAAAFVMIDYLGISYGRLLIHALLPAVLYFLSVLWIVHVRSKKRGFQAVPRSEIPDIRSELATRGHMVIPVIVLVGLLAMRHGVMSSAFWAVVAALAASILRPSTRLDAKKLYAAFHEAMAGMAPLVAICAGAGIVIGVLAASGLSLKIAYLIEQVAAGSLSITLGLTMIACIVLGMGLPTVAAYVVLATLVPASLTALGVSDIAAHLFIFYFAILSAVTPPVCTGAYVAAGIARADPIDTGFTALKLGLIVFLLPWAFVYEPALLMIGSPASIVLHATTCILGIGCWAYGLEGWYRRDLGLARRGLLMAAGAMLVWPSLWVSLIGIAAGGAALGTVEFAERRVATA